MAQTSDPSAPPELGGKRVFLSHGGADKRQAELVCARLEEAGYACWIAPRDIPSGSSWAGAILEAVRDCELFVLVLSEASCASEHVSREVNLASDEGAPVFILRLDAVELPSDLRYFLTTHQFVEIDARSGPLAAHVERLAEAVRTHFELGRATVPPAPATRRNGLRIAGGSAVLALALVGFAAWSARSDGSGEGASDADRTPATIAAELVATEVFEAGPLALTIADLDRDGRQDVIVRSPGTGDAAWVWDQGGEQRRALPELLSGSLDVADLNDDGHLDLVQPDGRGVRIIDGGPLGTFATSARPVALDSDTGHGLIVADLNHDGLVDLGTVAERALFIQLHYATPAGAFEFAQSLNRAPALPLDGARVVEDFDGDGWLDIALLGSTPTVLFGSRATQGPGGCRLELFRRPARGIPLGSGSGPGWAADVDADGDLDLVVSQPGEERVAILVNDGEASFGAPRFVEWPGALSAATGDFDGDGTLDLAVASAAGLAVLRDLRSALETDGLDGLLALNVVLPASAGALVAADVLGDGTAELILAHPASGEVSVVRVPSVRRGWDRTLAPPLAIEVRANLARLRVGDAAGDRRADLITAHSDPRGLHEVSILASSPAGKQLFDEQTLIDLERDPNEPHQFVDLSVADFDEDGRSDMVVFLVGEGGVMCVLRAIELADHVVRASSFSDFSMSQVTIGDVTGDGHVDLIWASEGVLAGDGAGGFGRGGSTPPTAPGVLGDFDGDGALDLAWLQSSGRPPHGPLMWAPGTTTDCPPHNDGRFDEWLEIERVNADDLVSGNFDRNGRDDLAYLAGGRVSLRLSEPGRARIRPSQREPGTEARFAAPVLLEGDGVRALCATDFDRDGDTDLVTCGAQGIRILLADRGAFEVAHEAPLEIQGTPQIVTGDFDGDGQDDIAVADPAASRVYVLLAGVSNG